MAITEPSMRHVSRSMNLKIRCLDVSDVPMKSAQIGNRGPELRPGLRELPPVVLVAVAVILVAGRANVVAQILVDGGIAGFEFVLAQAVAINRIEFGGRVGDVRPGDDQRQALLREATGNEFRPADPVDAECSPDILTPIQERPAFAFRGVADATSAPSERSTWMKPVSLTTSKVVSRPTRLLPHNRVPWRLWSSRCAPPLWFRCRARVIGDREYEGDGVLARLHMGS